MVFFLGLEGMAALLLAGTGAAAVTSNAIADEADDMDGGGAYPPQPQRRQTAMPPQYTASRAAAMTAPARPEVHLRKKGAHFYAPVVIAGVAFEAMVDSGASSCVLSHEAVRRLGQDPRALRYDGSATLANGGSCRTATVHLDLCVAGILATGVECKIIKDDPGRLGSLIGQSFLRRLHSIEQRGATMVLRP
jgi:clan AA aspartic protease (TIGR02281 family)